jgi:hypothetical protein
MALLTNDELERVWKEAIMAQSRYYPRICLEVMRETTKNLVQDAGVPAEI